MDVIRSYDAQIPSFLHKRPPKFVNHCLKRLPPAVCISLQHVADLGNGKFTVKSESGETSYGVYVASSETVTAPWCDCVDWARRHLLCKHMLAVFSHFPDYSWEKLPQDYTSLPIFTLDPDLLDEVERTCWSRGTQPTVSYAVGRTDVPQPPAVELPADEETTSHPAAAMSTSVHMTQVEKIWPSLCTLTSLTYRLA